jgi:hypothetical protein
MCVAVEPVFLGFDFHGIDCERSDGKNDFINSASERGFSDLNWDGFRACGSTSPPFKRRERKSLLGVWVSNGERSHKESQQALCFALLPVETASTPPID